MFDGHGLTVQDQDQAGRAIVTTRQDDDVVSTYDQTTGLKSTVVRDAMGNVTDEWGPAPASWWPSTSSPGAPTSNQSQTPHKEYRYDEGLTSLAATWYATTDLTGDPVATATGVGHGSGAISASWGSGSPASGVPADFSGELTGWVNIPDTAAREVRLNFGGVGEVVIGDQLVVDGWTSTTGSAVGS